MTFAPWWVAPLGFILVTIYFLGLVALHCRIERLRGDDNPGGHAMKRSYRWTGERFVEIEPEDHLSYADKAAAERELERRKRDEDERRAHPGQYA